MAEKLLQYYKYVSEKKGISGKVKLAQRTNIPSVVAALEPDSPELLKIFDAAFAEITGEPPPKIL